MRSRQQRCLAHASAAPSHPGHRQQYTAASADLAPPSAVYVHLPFCKRKCFYCDFPVEAVGGNPGKDRVQRRMSDYVDVLLREVGATMTLNDPKLQPLETVYFGGGTPSLLPVPQLERILGAIRSKYGLAQDAEVSIEADPGTFDGKLLDEYRRLGFNRLSIGVQSFQEDLLRACGRAHTLPDVRAALSAAASSSFPTWSLDLMCGLPGLTRAAWRASLSEAAASGAPHVSVYDLQVEEGTPFARWYQPGTAPLPEDADAAGMYEDASEALRRAGFEHYEVSNYARPGHRSRHNQQYWGLRQYYAFGVGAASYLAGRRYSRPKVLAAYCSWVDGAEAAAAAAGAGAGAGAASVGVAGAVAPGMLPGHELPPESQEERLLDAIMLGLRTADGLDLEAVASRYGRGAVDAMAPVLLRREGDGLVQLSRRPGGGSGGGREDAQVLTNARLTDPAGFLVSNDIISDLFAAF